jgi:hypothetical protein
MRKRACTDLRGGRSAMVVPTATLIAYVLIDMMFRDGVWLNTSLKLREQRLGHSDAPILAAL